MHIPLISIITVTYNAENVIRPTLDSVARQTMTDYEMIVVDGASSDNTVAIARSYAGKIASLQVNSEPDFGIYDAMNKGMDMARGRYLMFLNAGDSLHSSDTLARIASAADNGNDPGIIYGQTDIVDSSRKKVGERHLRAPENLSLKDFSRGMVVCHQAFIVNHRLADHYSLRYRFSSDYDWCVRMLQRSRCNVYIPDVIVDYLNEGMTTRNHCRSLLERFRIMSRYYGLVHTAVNHLGFARRYARRKRTNPESLQ